MSKTNEWAFEFSKLLLFFRGIFFKELHKEEKCSIMQWQKNIAPSLKSEMKRSVILVLAFVLFHVLDSLTGLCHKILNPDLKRSNQ
jgi:hypothetical protein